MSRQRITVNAEPIFTSARFASCHAPTIVELADGTLLAAWFGGTREGHPDVAIWQAHFDGTRWNEPVEVADEPNVPLWNPVLFRDAAGIAWLFYKVGPTIPAWTGVYILSRDGGRTWSQPTVLPAGLLGPTKNKPITLSNGDILCGTSSETWRSWTCWVEISSDHGRTWNRYGPIVAPGQSKDADRRASSVWDGRSHGAVLPGEFAGVIQPTVWETEPGHLTMLMRSTRAVGAVCLARSNDGGHSWTPAQRTTIPNPNSGLDAVRLRDGGVVLACNPTQIGRTPLSLLMSDDNGSTWPWRLDLQTAPGEYSYPSLIQASDNRIHIVYTYRREQIWHAMFHPNCFQSA